MRFLASAVERARRRRQQLFAGCFGIFGHGNVAGIGQALLQTELRHDAGDEPPAATCPARNEQAMVHTAVGYARQKDRLQTWACTASVGPGSTNMLTGAALATINRLPVLLLPSGTLRDPGVRARCCRSSSSRTPRDVTVNDAFRPLSRFFDRVNRPEQLPAALLGAMRVLTDPVETGAVTIALPQDVQAEALRLAGRAVRASGSGASPGRCPSAVDVADAAALIRGRERPLIVAGGGVHYSGAEEALRAFCRGDRHPGRREPGGQGLAAARPPAGDGRRRLHRDHCRQRARR